MSLASGGMGGRKEEESFPHPYQPAKIVKTPRGHSSKLSVGKNRFPKRKKDQRTFLSIFDAQQGFSNYDRFPGIPKSFFMSHNSISIESNQIFNWKLFSSASSSSVCYLPSIFQPFFYPQQKTIWVAINNTNSCTWTSLLQVHWFIAEIEIKFIPAQLPAPFDFSWGMEWTHMKLNQITENNLSELFFFTW